MTNSQKGWTAGVLDKYLVPANFNFTEVLTHADFGGDHILVDEHTGKITGVIDFGDIAIGDPAYDFYQQRSYYGDEFLKKMLSDYTLPVDNRFYSRVDFYEKVKPFHRIIGGINLGKGDELKLGLQKLDQTIGPFQLSLLIL